MVDRSRSHPKRRKDSDGQRLSDHLSVGVRADRLRLPPVSLSDQGQVGLEIGIVNEDWAQPLERLVEVSEIGRMWLGTASSGAPTDRGRGGGLNRECAARTPVAGSLCAHGGESEG